MQRYKNRGVSGALGIIGVALFATHFRLIVTTILLFMIPWWVYPIIGGGVAMLVILDYFTKQGDKDGIK